MSWIGAGLLAAAVAYMVNRFAYRVWHDTVLFGPVPLAEEVVKTMAAHFLGTSILYTHLIFGVTEALLDWQGKRSTLMPAISALVAHSIFGVLTVAVLRQTAQLGLAIVVAFLAHALWNALMLLRPTKR